MSHARVIACARAFLGVRFAHQGRNEDGLDCLGLLITSAAKAGVRLRGQCPTLLDDRQYGTRPDTEYLQAKLDAHLQPVETMRPGDVLLLNIAERPQHLALISDYPVVGEFGMIHSYAVARRVVEHRLDAAWRARIARIYRLPD